MVISTFLADVSSVAADVINSLVLSFFGKVGKCPALDMYTSSAFDAEK